MSKIIKVILAVLFFICLLKMPYGYYQLVRALAMIGFAILAFQAYNSKRIIEMIVYIGLAILFQPLFKIPLGREVWNILDVVVGIGLIVSVFLGETYYKIRPVFEDMSKISKLIICNLIAFVILLILFILNLISYGTFSTTIFIGPFLSLFISYSRNILILFWEVLIIFMASFQYFRAILALESKLEQVVFFLIIVTVSINSIVALIRIYISESKTNNLSSLEKAYIIIALIFFVIVPLFAGIYSEYNNMSSKEMKSEYEHRLESDTGIDSDDFD